MLLLTITTAVLAFIAGVAWARLQLQTPHCGVGGGSIMFIVKADNPDVGYTITPPTVTDSEGNAVPAGELVLEVTSDNPDAVQVSGTDALTGTVHFGAPNSDGTPALANLNVTVKNSAGTMLGSFGSQFTVTPGDPAAIVGGSISFNGLTEA